MDLATWHGLAGTGVDWAFAGYNNAARMAGWVTPARAAYGWSQVYEESAGFRATEEFSKGYYNGVASRYVPYCGRTFMQLTWDFNYLGFGQWLHARGLLGDPSYFLHNPAALAYREWAWLGVVYFWLRHNLNHYADSGDFVGLTRAINGGTNGLADRQAALAKAERYGTKLLPEGTTGMDEIEVRGMMVYGLRAVLLGDQKFHWNHTEHPAIVPATPAGGVIERLGNMERRLATLERAK